MVKRFEIGDVVKIDCKMDSPEKGIGIIVAVADIDEYTSYKVQFIDGVSYWYGPKALLLI